MKLSELAQEANIPISTLKLYQRKGLLPAAERISKTDFAYNSTHVNRIRTIRVLSEVKGLSLDAIREIVEVLDASSPEYPEVLGEVMDKLEQIAYPHAQDSGKDGAQTQAESTPEWLSGLLEKESIWKDALALPTLVHLLHLGQQAGVNFSEQYIALLIENFQTIARQEIALLSEGGASQPAAESALVGVAVVEDIILAIRRMCLQSIVEQQRLVHESASSLRDGANGEER